MKNRITLKNIANQANVSVRTVGRVLNNSPSVEKKTREKIKKILENSNYQPNLIARGLKSKITNTIGLIYIDFGSGMFNKIVKGIELEAEKNNYSLIVADSRYSDEIQEKNIINFINRMVDGLIILPCSSNFSYLQKFSNIIPIVNLLQMPDHTDSYWVSNDNLIRTNLAVDYLVKKGHKKIAYINFYTNLYTVKLRFKNFKLKLKEYGIEYNSNLVFTSGASIEDGYDVAEKIFNQNLEFTSIICWNDQMAIGVMQYCEDNNIKIPDECSIIGTDNDKQIVPYLKIPLTTIHFYKTKAGQKAAELLFKQINNEEIPDKKILFTPFVVERKSVKDIR